MKSRVLVSFEGSFIKKILKAAMRFWNIYEDIFLSNQRLFEIKVTNSFYLLILFSGRKKLHFDKIF